MMFLIYFIIIICFCSNLLLNCILYNSENKFKNKGVINQLIYYCFNKNDGYLMDSIFGIIIVILTIYWLHHCCYYQIKSNRNHLNKQEIQKRDQLTKTINLQNSDCFQSEYCGNDQNLPYIQSLTEILITRINNLFIQDKEMIQEQNFPHQNIKIESIQKQFNKNKNNQNSLININKEEHIEQQSVAFYNYENLFIGFLMIFYGFYCIIPHIWIVNLINYIQQ